MKKVLLVFILATGIFSCFCDDVDPYWNINNFSFQFFNDDGAWVSSDSISTDTLEVIIDIEFQYVAEVSFQNAFVPTATAVSCEDPGTLGMKDPVTNITFTCDQDFNNITAGQPLDSIIQFGDELGFQEFLDNIATFPAVDFFNFRITEKPTNLDSLKFILKMDLESGGVIERESEYIFWK